MKGHVAPSLSSARCSRHVEAPAVDVCQRCGTFVCGDCLELREGEPFCPDCFMRAKTGGASGRAIAALVLGIIGLNCAFLPGVVGLVLSQQELAAIERGEAPQTGRSLARGARVLGWINVGLLALAACAVVVFLLKLAR